MCDSQNNYYCHTTTSSIERCIEKKREYPCDCRNSKAEFVVIVDSIPAIFTWAVGGVGLVPAGLAGFTV